MIDKKDDDRIVLTMNLITKKSSTTSTTTNNNNGSYLSMITPNVNNNRRRESSLAEDSVSRTVNQRDRDRSPDYKMSFISFRSDEQCCRKSMKRVKTQQAQISIGCSSCPPDFSLLSHLCTHNTSRSHQAQENFQSSSIIHLNRSAINLDESSSRKFD